MEATMQEANLSPATLTQSQYLTDRQEQPRWFSRMTRAMIAGVLLSIAPLIQKAEAGDPIPISVAEGANVKLVIAGGGKLPPMIRDRLVEMGGGKEAHVVIITTADDDAGNPEKESTFFWEGLRESVASACLLHLPDYGKADSEEETAPLDKATVVWFSGGKQSRLSQAYLNTLTLTKVNNVLRRGGAVGGTSAGAAIMSTPMIAGGKIDPIMEDGFGFLPGTIICQHHLKRGREERMKKALIACPGRIGFGVDEETAMVIDGDTMTVLGNSTVSVYKPSGEVEQLAHGYKEKLTKFGMPVTIEPMGTAVR